MVNWKCQENFKKLGCLALLSTVGVASIIFLCCFFSKGYYSVFDVTFNKYNRPLVNIQLNNKDYALAMDIGCRFPLCLDQKTLDQISNKKPTNPTIVRNLDGGKREAPSYILPELKVGDLIIKDIVAYESEKNELNILGRFLGGEYNLLMDFPNHRVIACDTFSKLKAKIPIKKDWLCIPFEMHCSGVLLNAKTDLGVCKLVINTIYPVTCLRSSLIGSKEFVVSSSFVLGGEQFGNTSLELINLPEALQDIDGFIGMDFLKEHAIYLDYKNKLAYIERPERYLEPIPIVFSKRGHPIIETSIQGSTYPLELDLGSGILFSLSPENLQKISRTEYGYIKWSDFRGERYEATTYSIPEAKIRNLIFSQPIIGEENEDFHRNVTVEGACLPSAGTIGLPILHKYNLFLDFPHSMIYASRDYKTLQKSGLLSQNLLGVPFTISERIILSFDMDGGSYRLMLDTGATVTVMRAPFPSSTTKFEIMGHDFGKRSMKVLDISHDFDCDGFLGLDFLREHPMFIDYVNQVLYIDLEKNLEKA